MGKKKRNGEGGGSVEGNEVAEAGSGSASSAYAQLSFTDVLEDLSSRFIVNLPAEEQVSIQRICFQVEQAHWFYEDFLRPLNPSLPSLALRRFSSYLLHTAALTVPLIQKYIASGSQNDVQGLEAAFEEFMRYKTRVPVCGVVMLNAKLDKCLLVKGWKASATWGFPKGKINQKESERDCAVREVYEETGFDCSPLLAPDSLDFMELTMREQKIRLYIVPGLDESTHFETQTRKEISKIAWFKLSELPTWKKNKAPPQGMGGKFYLISPFIGKLKQWIHDNRHKYVQGRDASTHEAAMDEEGDEGEDVGTAAVLDNGRSNDLKSFLGISSPLPPHVEPNGALQINGQGARMIEEQGNERSRQLLDLLRGAPSTANVVPGVAQLDFGRGDNSGRLNVNDQEQGAASLLEALNAGSGNASSSAGQRAWGANEVQSYNGSNGGKDESSTALLSLLNGLEPRSHTGHAPPPLAAPQAQRTTQAQSLLDLISPASLQTQPSETRVTAPFIGEGLKPETHSPLHPQTSLSDKELERAQKRDRLLSSLLSSSLSVQDSPGVSHTPSAANPTPGVPERNGLPPFAGNGVPSGYLPPQQWGSDPSHYPTVPPQPYSQQGPSHPGPPQFALSPHPPPASGVPSSNASNGNANSLLSLLNGATSNSHQASNNARDLPHFASPPPPPPHLAGHPYAPAYPHTPGHPQPSHVSLPNQHVAHDSYRSPPPFYAPPPPSGHASYPQPSHGPAPPYLGTSSNGIATPNPPTAYDYRIGQPMQPYSPYPPPGAPIVHPSHIPMPPPQPQRL